MNNFFSFLRRIILFGRLLKMKRNQTSSNPKTVKDTKRLRIKKILEFTFREFIYGGHLQSLGAVSIVFISALMLNIAITWEVLFFTYLTFYPVYVYNRFKEIDVDELTNPERVRHFKSYIQQIPKILYLSILLLVVSLIYFANFVFSVFSILLLFLGFLYTPTLKNATRKVIGFKNFYVAAFFSAVALFPIVYYSYPLTSLLVTSTTIFMIFVYFKALLMQILLDHKDVKSDKNHGLITIPLLLGERRTLKFLKVFSVLGTLPIPIFFSVLVSIFPKSILLLLLTIPFNFYCFYLVNKQKYIGYTLGSGEFLLWLILIHVGGIIF